MFFDIFIDGKIKYMGIIEQLRKQENFTSAESALADYIIANLDDVYRMSLQDLAKASYVSKPSVIRLYRKIGCNSYREFSIALQVELLNGGKITSDDDVTDLSGSASLYELAGKIGIIARQIVDNCISAIDSEGLDDIVNVINEAEHVYVYADEDVKLEVASFNRRMSFIGMDPMMINDVEDKKALIDTINDEDVVLMVSSNRGTDEDIAIRKMIESAPALKILVTTQDDPALHFKADYIFFTYPHGNDFVRNNIFVSQMSLLLGLNIIQISLCKIRGKL